MRDHRDDLPYIVIEKHSAGFVPFLWGTLIGAAIALWLAPRSGAETQEEIRQRVRRVRGMAEEKVEAARSTVNRTRERFENQIGSVRDQIGTVRERIEDRAEEARSVFDGSRRASRDRVPDLGASYRGDGREKDQDAAPRRDREVDVVLTDDGGRPAEERSDLG